MLTPCCQAQQLTWIITHKALVEVAQLICGNVAAWVIGGLEVQVVFAITVELGGCHIHTDDNLVRVARLVDSFLEELQSWEEESGSQESQPMRRALPFSGNLPPRATESLMV